MFVYFFFCFLFFIYIFFFFSSRRRHTRSYGDWSSDMCSSDLDEVFADCDQSAGRARERLLDRNLVEIRLRKPSPRLLVCGRFERLEQRLASREVAVERAARDPGRGCDLRHAGSFPHGKNTCRCDKDVPPPGVPPPSAHRRSPRNTRVTKL